MGLELDPEGRDALLGVSNAASPTKKGGISSRHAGRRSSPRCRRSSPWSGKGGERELGKKRDERVPSAAPDRIGVQVTFDEESSASSEAAPDLF